MYCYNCTIHVHVHVHVLYLYCPIHVYMYYCDCTVHVLFYYSYSYTPLMEAAREGHEDVVQLLVDHGKILVCLSISQN